MKITIFQCRKCKGNYVKEGRHQKYCRNCRKQRYHEIKRQYYFRNKTEIDNKARSETGKLLTRQYKQETKNKAYALLGGYKCSNPYNLPHPDWCNDKACLQIDHKIREFGKNKHWSWSSYKRIIDMGAEKANQHYQVLCANCNWIKRSKNKEDGKR